jgi:hypothetical protein
VLVGSRDRWCPGAACYHSMYVLLQLFFVQETLKKRGYTGVFKRLRLRETLS